MCEVRNVKEIMASIISGPFCAKIDIGGAEKIILEQVITHPRFEFAVVKATQNIQAIKSIVANAEKKCMEFVMKYFLPNR